LAIFVELRLVTDRQTDGRTDIFIYYYANWNADTAHTTNKTTQKIYRNTKFKKQDKTHYNL